MHTRSEVAVGMSESSVSYYSSSLFQSLLLSLQPTQTPYLHAVAITSSSVRTDTNVHALAVILLLTFKILTPFTNYQAIYRLCYNCSSKILFQSKN